MRTYEYPPRIAFEDLLVAPIIALEDPRVPHSMVYEVLIPLIKLTIPIYVVNN